MKKIFIYILLSLAIVSTNASAASTINELATKFGQETNSGDYDNAMVTAGNIVELLLNQGDIKSAAKFSDNLINATSPTIAKHGYFLKSLCWKAAYDISNDKTYLIKAGASVLNASQSDEAIALTSLLMKEYGGKQEVFVKLVKHEVNTQAIDKTLAAAYNHIKYGRWEIVQRYLDNKIVSVNDKLSTDGSTMLHMAVWYEKDNVVKKLVATYGANVNIIDKEGDTALGYAKHKKNSSMIKYLEKQGAR